MDSDRGVELGLRGITFESDRRSLDYFARIGTHHLASDGAAGAGIEDEVHEGAFVGAAHRMLERVEARLINAALAVALACFGLGQTDRPNRRLAEDGGRHVFVLDAHGLTVEERLRDCAALGNRHRCKIPAIRDVADCIAVRDGGARVAIHHHRSFSVQRDAGLFEPQLMRVRGSPRREHDQIRFERSAIAEPDANAGAAPFDFLDQRVEMKLDCALAHLAGERLAQIVVEAPQEKRSAMNQRDLGPEPVKNSGELDADVAATDDNRARREALEEKRLVRANRELGPGNFRYRRPSAGRDQDVSGGEALISNCDGMRLDDYGTAIDYPHPGVREQLSVNTVEPLDLLVLVGD